MTSLLLQPSQKEAVSRIIRFLDDPEPCFILRGSAGTGKTTLIAALLDELTLAHRSFHLVAPTGRATRILGAKTKQRAHTIHSTIYVLSDVEIIEDAESENDPGIRLTFPLRRDDPGKTLFIIDEASMVGDKENKQDDLRFGSGRLLKDIITYARLDRRDRDEGKWAKILFVGDPAQLPPVGERLSPALSENYLKEEYGLDCVVCELTEVIRQKAGGGILDCATSLRDAIHAQRFNTFTCTADSKEIIAATPSEGIKLVAEAQRHQGSRAVLITFSNAKAREHNRAVRAHIRGSETARLQEGDLLLVTKNSAKDDLYNGDLVKVLATSEHAECRRVAIRGVAEPIKLAFREAVLAYRTPDDTIERVKVLLLENLLDSPYRELQPTERRALLVDFRQRYPKLCPGTAEFRLTIRDDNYFNALHVKYGYALTCHKAQGGEWDTAIVDFDDARGRRNEDFFRWAYTSITRAKKQLYTIGVREFNEFTGINWGRLGVNHQEPVQSDAEDIELTADPDWDRFSFSTGQTRLFTYYQKARAALLSMDIHIQRIDHLQYVERYHLTRGGRHATIQYTYRANQQVTNIQIASPTVDLTLADDAVVVLKIVLIEERNRNDEPEIVSKLHRHVEKAIEGSNLRLLAVRSMRHRVRMEFQDNSHHTEIDFCYDKTGKVTSAEEVGGIGSSQGIIDQLRRLLEG